MKAETKHPIDLFRCIYDILYANVLYCTVRFGAMCDWDSSKWNDCFHEPLSSSIMIVVQYTVWHLIVIVLWYDKANFNDQSLENTTCGNAIRLLAIAMIRVLLMMVHPCVQWQRTKKHQDCTMSVAKPQRDWKDEICKPQGDTALANMLHIKQLVDSKPDSHLLFHLKSFLSNWEFV